MSKDATDALREYVEGVTKYLDQVKKDSAPEQRLSESVELYARLRLVIDDVAATVKELNKIKTHLQYTYLPQLMHSAGIKKSATFDAGRLTLTEQIRASIRAGMKEDAFEWLRENELDAMITETVNSGTLSALAKGEIAEARELPDKLFNVAINELVSFTKSNSKK